MGLRDIKIHRTTIKYRDDQEITVRGISASDLMMAAQDYGPQLAMIFAKVQQGDFDGDIKTAIAAFAKDAPVILGATIALASDEYDPEMVDIASKLPFSVQAECLEAIFNETFYSEAEVKKLIESLRRMIAAVSGALTDVMPSASEIGIGGLGERLAS